MDQVTHAGNTKITIKELYNFNSYNVNKNSQKNFKRPAKPILVNSWCLTIIFTNCTLNTITNLFEVYFLKKQCLCA